MPLSFPTQSVFGAEAKTVHSGSLRRYKREWIVPPQILEENVDYTKQIYIARVRMHSLICFYFLPRPLKKITHFATLVFI